MNNLTNYVSLKTYFADLKVIDERLSNIEHMLDIITKNDIENLEKETNNENSLAKQKKSRKNPN